MSLGRSVIASRSNRRRIPGWVALVGLVVLAFGAMPDLASGQRLGGDMGMMKSPVMTYVAFDELEFQATGDEDALEYDGEAWIGGDFNRIWFKAAGEQSTTGSDGEVELQGLFSRGITPFWNLQTGLRLDHRYGEGPGATRAHAVLGLEGLAPYWFEVEAFVYLSDDGDGSARLEASYETLLTQRLIVESEFETNVAFQDAPEFGLASGFNDVELGARMRYEFVREFAPYVGYSWSRLVGGTADLVREGGGEVGGGALVFGLHVWY